MPRGPKAHTNTRITQTQGCYKQGFQESTSLSDLRTQKCRSPVSVWSSWDPKYKEGFRALAREADL